MAIRKAFQPGKPVRKVVTQCSARVTGRFASRKMGRMIPWESQIERDFLYILEADPTVIEIHAQPLQLDVWFDGTRHSYTPDFLVQHTDGRTFIYEVKPEDARSDVDLLRYLHKVSLAVGAETGHQFAVVFERDIRCEPRLSNARHLARAARFDIDRHIIDDILDWVRPLAVVTIRDIIMAGLASQHQVMTVIGRGHLLADTNSPLGPDSTVWPANGQRSLP